LRRQLLALGLVRIVQCQSEFVEFSLIEIEDVVLLDLVGVSGEISQVVWIAQVVAGVVELTVVRVLDHGFDVRGDFEVRGA